MGVLITIHASVFLLLLGIFTLVALPMDRGSMKVYAYLLPSFAIYLALFHSIKVWSKPRRRVREAPSTPLEAVHNHAPSRQRRQD
jgi:hypothetical protein